MCIVSSVIKVSTSRPNLLNALFFKSGDITLHLRNRFLLTVICCLVVRWIYDEREARVIYSLKTNREEI